MDNIPDVGLAPREEEGQGTPEITAHKTVHHELAHVPLAHEHELGKSEGLAVGVGQVPDHLFEGVLGPRLVIPDVQEIQRVDYQGAFQLGGFRAAPASESARTRQLDEGVFLREQKLEPGIAVENALQLIPVIEGAHVHVHMAVREALNDSGNRVRSELRHHGGAGNEIEGRIRYAAEEEQVPETRVVGARHGNGQG